MSKHLHIRISDEIDFMLKMIERKTGLNRSQVVRNAIKQYFLLVFSMNKDEEG